MCRLKFGCLACLCLASACGAGWRRVEVAPEQTLRPQQQVQVWSGRQARVLHGVAFGTDSVTGIPFHRPLDCDSCRVAISWIGVDSVRLGDMDHGAYRSIGAAFLAAAVVAGVLYLSVDHD